jgi:hypothetical protein
MLVNSNFTALLKILNDNNVRYLVSRWRSSGLIPTFLPCLLS